MTNNSLCLHGLPIDDNCDKCNNLLGQIRWCEYCDDGIPKQQMDEHLSWCKPMIEANIQNGDSG